MSLPSEHDLSLAELRARNQPVSTPPPKPHPTEEEWSELSTAVMAMGEILADQVILLEELTEHSRSVPAVRHLRELQTELKESTAELRAIHSLIEQAGRKKERRFSIRPPRIDLPRPSPAWLLAIPMLGALCAGWYGLATLWNTLSPLLP